MRAEHEEAMERTEALMRENACRPGHNFGRSIVPPLLGLAILGAVVGFVFLMDAVESSSVRLVLACCVPLGLAAAFAFASFIRRRT